MEDNLSGSERRIDIWDAGVVFPHVTKFIRLNSHVRDLVSEVLGAVDEGSVN